MKYKAIIFNNDGTLFDTEPINFEARQKVLKKYGVTLSREDYVKYWMGRHLRIGVAFTFQTMVVDERERITEEIETESQSIREVKLSAVPSVKFLLHELKWRFAFAIATALPQKIVERGLTLVFGEERRLFSVIVSGDDVRENKPSPDVYLVTADRLGISPTECIVIEDSIAGVTAAKSANMCCIARASEWTSAQELYDADADIVCQDYRILARLLVS